MKVLTILAILLILPGIFMFTAAASPALEAGAHAAWEGTSSASKCFIRWHDQPGGQSVVGTEYGHGPAAGGYIGIHICDDIDSAKNVCDDNIDEEYDCVAIGTVNQCGIPCRY